MKAVPPSIYPRILWSCLHFSLCLFYIFITSWGLRLSGVRSLVLSGPPPGGLFAEELRGHLAPFSPPPSSAPPRRASQAASRPPSMGLQ